MGKPIKFPTKEKVAETDAARQAYRDKIQAAVREKSTKEFNAPDKGKRIDESPPSKYIPRIYPDGKMREGRQLRTNFKEKMAMNKMSAAERAKYKAKMKAKKGAKHLGSKASN